MKPYSTVVFVVLCAVVLPPFGFGTNVDVTKGDALLAEIMDRPGSWSQMCLAPPPVAFNVPVPLVRPFVAYRQFGLDEKGLKRAAANRSAVVMALKKSLAGMDLAHAPTSAEAERPTGRKSSGLKPDWFNPIHLELIKKLQAIEVLPELLRLEDQLFKLLEAAQGDPKAPLPALPLDSPAGIAEEEAVVTNGLVFGEAQGEARDSQTDEGKRVDWTSPEYLRKQSIFACRIFQREMLGVTVQLLRAEEWGPLMASECAMGKERSEATQKRIQEATAAREKAVTNDKAARKSQDKILKNKTQKELRLADLALVSANDSADTAAFTPELRSQIRGWATDFLAAVPPEKWRGAAAMPKDPK